MSHQSAECSKQFNLPWIDSFSGSAFIISRHCSGLSRNKMYRLCEVERCHWNVTTQRGKELTSSLSESSNSVTMSQVVSTPASSREILSIASYAYRRDESIESNDLDQSVDCLPNMLGSQLCCPLPFQTVASSRLTPADSRAASQQQTLPPENRRTPQRGRSAESHALE